MNYNKFVYFILALAVTGCSINSNTGDNVFGALEPLACTSFESGAPQDNGSGNGRNCDLDKLPERISYTFHDLDSQSSDQNITIHLAREGSKIKGQLFASCIRESDIDIKYFVQIYEELDVAIKNQRAKTVDDIGWEFFKIIEGSNDTDAYVMVRGPSSETVIDNQYRASLRSYIARLKGFISRQSGCMPWI